MRKLLLTLGFMLGIIAVPYLGFSGAEDAELDETGEFAYGTVVSIKADEIVINEYDYNTEEYKHENFLINSETKFENVESFREIAIGDDVELKYEQSGSQKIAVVITKEDSLLPEDNLTYEDYPEDIEVEKFLEENEDTSRE